MDHLLPIVFVFLTCIIFLFWRFLSVLPSLGFINPLLLSIVSIALLLHLCGVSYQEYMLGGQWLNYLLEPAVVLLGYPLFLQLKAIRRHWWPLLACCSIGAISAICCSVLVAKGLGADLEVLHSIATLCVTTAVSMEVSEQMGGSRTLAAVMVMIAGITGSVFGLALLNFLKVRSSMARGLAMGVSSHALGTATIAQHSTASAAYASTALILSAIITAIVAPILVPMLIAV